MKIRRKIEPRMMKVTESDTKKQFSRVMLTGCLLLAGVGGCNEHGDAVNPDGNGGITGVGIPNGTAVASTIGAAGGTISSADNLVTLTIPAGALSKDTEISIQSITNEAPNGLGQAYRFSPDGTTFARPASLTFRYDPRTVSANNPDAFRVATQGADRRWYRTAKVAVDTASHTITAAMPHFSDWSAYQLAVMKDTELKGADYVELGASTDLSLGIYNELIVFESKEAGEDLEVEDVQWEVAGGAVNGSVKASGKKDETLLAEFYSAVYRAPGKNPASNPVTVVANVKFKGKQGKFQVIKQILVGKDYYRGTFAGAPFDMEHLYFTHQGGSLIISGYNENPDQSMHLLIGETDTLAPNRIYRYTESVNTGAWGEFTRTYAGNEGGWISAHADCPRGIRVSPDGVTITQISLVNGIEYVQGHFAGTYYNRTAACPVGLRSAPIEGEFRIRNSRDGGRKPADFAKFKGNRHP
ncbi:hypothetical protein [Dyadobacter sp. 676]|uniref:ZU5 domain-containing protein n=1 Tax=Dyadobacter sp. 676 TaxID=3088362 RepID=A0AAU8FNA8_9BACT